MIKHLDGIKETVDYAEIPNLKLYDNVEYEEYPFHWHSAVEIIMPIHRSYHVEISNQMYHLKEGDILVIAPGTLHRLLASEGERLILLVDVASLKITIDPDSILSFIQPALLITKQGLPSIYDRCHKLLTHSMNTYFGTEPFKALDIFSDLLKLFSLIGRSFTTQNQMFDATTGSKQQEYIKKFMDLCEYINAHCSEDISLDTAAEMIGFSKYHFSRLFKDFTGNTYYKYLNTCRVSRAENLLLDPEISITEAAMRSGFNSISSFIRMFKIVKGCTPTDFRKMQRPESFSQSGKRII